MNTLEPLPWEVAFDPTLWAPIVPGERHVREVLRPKHDSLLCGHSVYPRLAFSTREGTRHVALGCVHRVTNLEDADLQTGRYYGGSRFDPSSTISEEWSAFGSTYWFLPQIEVVDNLIIINASSDPNVAAMLLQLHQRTAPALAVPRSLSVSEPYAFPAFKEAVEEIIRTDGLDKVVIARRVDLCMESIHPLALMEEVMACTMDARRYTLFFMPTEDSCFFSLSPERLIKVHQGECETEALAGTYTREEYDLKGDSLLDDTKTTLEHRLVADFVEQKLNEVATSEVSISSRTITKLVHLVHLKQQYKTTVECPVSWFVRELSPTPAVGGVPVEEAKQFITEHEPFDRGFYAGPCGFADAEGGEMMVALRSGLWSKKTNTLMAYGGSGICEGSDPSDEWKEIDTKLLQFVSTLTRKVDLLSTLRALPNPNALYSTCIVEELVRQKVTYFIICPGSRSTPLVCAITKHPRCTHIVHNDERGACFHALGYCKTGKLCAVLVTSGTAVANLLPAVVEASLALGTRGPIILSADRPMDVRSTGANQTLPDQSRLLSGCVRWSKDILAPPSAALPSVLSDVGWAVSEAAHGPVHLNFQFKENLAPDAGPIRDDPLGRNTVMDLDVLHGVERWAATSAPWATYHPAVQSRDKDIAQVLEVLDKCKRIAVVVGQLLPEDVEVAQFLAPRLGHCILADATSGLRPWSTRADQVLSYLGSTALFDGMIILGGAVTSKRLNSLPAYVDGPVVRVVPVWCRADPPLRCNHVLQCPLDTLASFVKTKRLQDVVLQHMSDQIGETLDFGTALTEPWIAHACSSTLPPQAALWLASSMPIRDMDTFMSAGPVRPVAANRGASGIEGVIDSAAGFCAGLRCPTVCVIGDVSSIVGINALHNLSDCLPEGAPLTIVIVNNRGGGIFAFLPIVNHAEVFTPYFDSPTNVDFARLAQGFHVEYRLATTRAEFTDILSTSLTRPRGVMVLEVPSELNHKENVTLHAALTRQVHKAAPRALAATLATQLAWMHIGPVLAEPYVLLHGWLGAKEDWIDAVGPRTSCYVFDLPGHGQSPDHPLFFCFDVLVDAIALILDTVRVTKVHLCGYSLGGRIASHFRHRFPQRVLSLTLLSSHIGLTTDAMRSQRLAEDHALARTMTLPLTSFFDRWYAAPLWANWSTRSPSSFARMMDQKRDATLDGVRRALLGFSVGRQQNYSEGNFTFVCGALDAKYTELGHEWEQSLPNVHLVVLPECSHGLLFEAPQAVANLLLQSTQATAVGEVAESAAPFHDGDFCERGHFELRFLVPLQLSRGMDIAKREGIIVAVTIDGATGLGEVCPLPHFHAETYEDAKAQLRDESQVPHHHISRDWLATAKLYPSVRSGIEMAVAHALWQRHGLPHLRRSHTRTNSLLTHRESPCGTPNGPIKVKVGTEWEHDAARVNEIIAAYPRCHLRLDANRGWTSTQAQRFLDALSSLDNIEYIEEPVVACDGGDNTSLIARWRVLSERVSLAVDESLTEGLVTLDQLATLECTIVLKPALHGYQRAKDVIAWAEHHGKRVILSSCFESSIAISHYAILAAQMVRDDVHGLGTSSRFVEDIFRVDESLPTLGLIQALNAEVTHGKLRADGRFAHIIGMRGG
eukprot:GEMP01000645.1.p1 GENE.GEMP01000645.1~~GEMP01000645.1.p1  ORF type:complete len:1619 (+),score=425.85 GEMP01000645.1:240-5096(+)